MADNESYAGRNGVYDDWIELYNDSDQQVSLSGYALSDDPSKPLEWHFPEGTVIAARGYLLVYASGRSDTPLDASFRLNPEGETVLLSDAKGAFWTRWTTACWNPTGRSPGAATPGPIPSRPRRPRQHQGQRGRRGRAFGFREHRAGVSQRGGGLRPAAGQLQVRARLGGTVQPEPQNRGPLRLRPVG